MGSLCSNGTQSNPRDDATKQSKKMALPGSEMKNVSPVKKTPSSKMTDFTDMGQMPNEGAPNAFTTENGIDLEKKKEAERLADEQAR